MKWAYYNDNDANACAWIRQLIKDGLITDGEVDERSITNVRADDLRGFRRVHLFAGIGGWDYALQLAGWPDDEPVWTASFPCQPFSAAGLQMGSDDPRHLFPTGRKLVARCNPATVFGEQVAVKLGREWLARVRVEMATLGYAVTASDLCAAGAGAPQIRQRLYWVAHPHQPRPQGRPERWVCTRERAPWASSLAVSGNDGRTRRVEPGIPPVAHGLSSRVALIRGSGNAIVPQIAAKFIEASRETSVERPDILADLVF